MTDPGQFAFAFVTGFACGGYLMDWLVNRRRRRALAEAERRLAAAEKNLTRGCVRREPPPPPSLDEDRIVERVYARLADDHRRGRLPGHIHNRCPR